MMMKILQNKHIWHCHNVNISGELKSAFAEVKKLDGSLARHTGEEEESIAVHCSDS